MLNNPKFRLTPRQTYYLKNTNAWLMGFALSFALGYMMFRGNLLYSAILAISIPTLPLIAAKYIK